jgi:hypothetical protein
MKIFLGMAAASLFALTVAGQAATLVVVEARGMALKPGSLLDSAKPLVLKQGQHVTLVTDTGSTLKLDGPYNRPPAASAGGGVTLTKTLGALVAQRQSRSGEFGTTRGTVLAALPDPWLIDASHGGHACLMAGAMPVFWRPATRDAATLAVAPLDHSWNARSTWPAGQDRLPITTDVPMRSGETYAVSFGGADYAITMTLVPADLASDEMRAGFMADKGCEQQAQALAQTSAQTSAKARQ